MGVQIHALPEALTVAGGEYFVKDNGSVTEKIDYDTLAAAIIEQFAGSTIGGSAQTLKNAIDTLTSTVTTMQAMEDLTSQVTTSTYVNNVALYRFGRVYYLRFAITASMPASSWTTLLSLPADYTPGNDVAMAHTHFNTTNVGKDVEVSMRMTGEARGYLSSALASTTSVTCSGCWIK